MEGIVLALTTAVLNLLYALVKNRFQDQHIAKLETQQAELQIKVDECHDERDELRQRLGDISPGSKD